jgi:hypothetical protein
MENIESITVLDRRRSHWKVKGPADSFVEWDSLITDDIPGELIAWESAEGTSVPNSGRIEFRASYNGRGTVVTATIAYDPPAGARGAAGARCHAHWTPLNIRPYAFPSTPLVEARVERARRAPFSTVTLKFRAVVQSSSCRGMSSNQWAGASLSRGSKAGVSNDRRASKTRVTDSRSLAARFPTVRASAPRVARRWLRTRNGRVLARRVLEY